MGSEPVDLEQVDNQKRGSPTAAPRSLEQNSDGDVSRLIARVSVRLDHLLEPAEGVIAALFERAANPAEVSAASTSLLELTGWLGELGARHAAQIADRAERGLRGCFERGVADPAFAIEAASLLEDIRTEMSMTSHAVVHGARLLFRGETSDELDWLVWASALAGFEVSTGNDDGGAPNLIIITGGDNHRRLSADVSELRSQFPGVPVLATATQLSFFEQAALSRSCESLLIGPNRPTEVLDEARELLNRKRATLRFVHLNTGAGPSTEALAAAGLEVNESRNAHKAVELLATGKANALVVCRPPTKQLQSLFSLIRARPTARRAAIIECVIDPSFAEHPGTTSLADARIQVGEANAAVTAITGAANDLMTRRGELGAIPRETATTGLPWFSGRARGERIIQQAQRRERPITLGLFEFSADVSELDVDQVQYDLSRQFRDHDVVTRRDGHQNVMVVDGIGRRIALRRFASIAERFGHLTPRVAVAEFPFDGRTFDTLLAASDSALQRSSGETTDVVVGVDWQSKDLRSDHDLLLVDGDESLSAVLSAALERAGVRARALTTSAEALEELLDPNIRKPRLVVLEFDLPGLDGLSTLRKLQSAGVLSRLNVVMVGSRTREVDLDTAFELGVIDVVRKPLSPHIAVHRLQRAMNR